jgi:hypothetical protein
MNLALAIARLVVMAVGVVMLGIGLPGPAQAPEAPQVAQEALTGTDAPMYSDEWGEVPVLPWQGYMPPQYCEPVPVEEATDDAVDYLLSVGWQGDPADGMEALYPMGCV